MDVYVGYMWGTCGVHVGYMWGTCGAHVGSTAALGSVARVKAG